VTARRQFGAAIVACVAGAGLVLLALRQGWARVDYTAPKPLPSGSIPVSGQDLLPAAGALALAALACMAAVIATRGAARQVIGVVMAGLGAWIAVLVSEPVPEATVLATASGQAAGSGFAGSPSGGNSAISGGVPSGGALPAIGQASRVVLASGPWRAAALIGALAVIAAGLAAAWRGPRWAVMSARFDQAAGRGPRPAGGPSAPASAAVPATGAGAAGSRTVPGPGAAVPASQPVPPSEAAAPASPAAVPASEGAAPPSPAAVPAFPAAVPASPAAVPASEAPAPASPAAVPASEAPARAAQHVPAGGPGPADPSRAKTPARALRPEDDAAALWEALDRGVDLTDTADGGAEPVAAPAQAEES
jgi:Tryptophan-associated transmembrane protein (Trp_oprn_chp)